MKKTIRNILIPFALLPLLTQCASQDEVQRLQYQLRVVNSKLEEMKSTTVGDIQKRQAASSSQIDQLDKEILSLKSQLEETNHRNQMLREQNKELEASISSAIQEEATKQQEALDRLREEDKQKAQTIAELNDQLRVQQDGLRAIQDARVRDAERRAREAQIKADKAKAKALASSQSVSHSSKKGIVLIRATKTKKKRDVPKPVATTTPKKKPEPTVATTVATDKKTTSEPQTPVKNPPPKTTPAASPDIEYANQLCEKKEFAKARSAFESHQDSYTGTETVDANYLMAECYYNKQEYDLAFLDYQKFVLAHKQHPLAATAILKQAQSLEQMGMYPMAETLYTKIMNEYGSSPEASTAKKKLGQ